MRRSKGKKRRERGIALGFTKGATQKVAWIVLFFYFCWRRASKATQVPEPLKPKATVGQGGTIRASSKVPAAFQDARKSKRPKLLPLPPLAQPLLAEPRPSTSTSSSHLAWVLLDPVQHWHVFNFYYF